MIYFKLPVLDRDNGKPVLEFVSKRKKTA